MTGTITLIMITGNSQFKDKNRYSTIGDFTLKRVRTGKNMPVYT